ARPAVVADSCYSASRMGPLRLRSASERLAQEFAAASSPARRGSSWDKLFALASSRHDETSLSGFDGSVFTIAFKKACLDAESSGGTMGDLVRLTETYTEGHDPVARFVPASLESELLIP